MIAAVTMITAACSSSGHDTCQDDLSCFVNPFIGTDYTGNTYPGAQVPFGMVQLSPDNGLGGWDRIAGYFYPDSLISGFSHTHLSGTGAGDLYDVSFMPVMLPYTGDVTGPLAYASSFSHNDETASPGYYSVLLKDSGIFAELTATERGGLQRYTFPGGRAAIIMDLAKAMNWDATKDTQVRLADSLTVSGYRYSDGWARNQRVYFATRFSSAPAEIMTDTIALAGGGKGLVTKFCFDTAPGDQIVIATALSPTSEEEALRNLAAEIPDNDFDTYRSKAKAMWNDELARIIVDTTDSDLLTVFYTALYHAMLAPTIYNNADGSYLGPDGNVHPDPGFTNYSTFSTWDTYRAAHPLYTIIDPARASDMVKSLIAFARENGRLPVWNMWASETDMMIGYHSAPIIADAIEKGITDVDVAEALALSAATARMDDYRRLGDYRSLGYVPVDNPDGSVEEWSMSKTLEYAYDDYAISRIAAAAGDSLAEREFLARSRSYKNVYNPASGFMQPRMRSGEFVADFNPTEYTPHICESNAWHYLWSVQHEPDSLMALMGGRDRFEIMLDSLFSYSGAGEDLPIFSTGMIGQYAQGNEPSHHAAYLYNIAGTPHKAAENIRKIMETLYLNSPAGLCGNEDCGQMSAWFVFSAMGFYPVNPVGGRYEIGSPLFDRVVIPVAEGKVFTLLAPGASDGNIYVKSVKVDGTPWHKSYITHNQIISGATVELEMSSAPAPAWYEK